jgi:hypothetical protein
MAHGSPQRRFFLENVGYGILIGTGFAALMLFTNSFGIASLIQSDTSPLVSAGVFAVGCITIFVPLVLSTAIGLMDVK